MNARALLAKLRHGENPEPEELSWMAQALASHEVSDAQAGAFAMAICLNGLDEAGRAALTLAMRDSGHVLSWDLDAPVLDKHSTGGVGDCVSLILAPALAACGVYVPMISGRGLGHTGGTLDKLEAIPGLNVHVDEARLKQIVAEVGCAIVGATADIAPADKRLYAVRDVSSTVDSLDLITASILSKKLAANLDGLVLDVKVGSGAFMKELEDARALSRCLVQTANQASCPTTAIITDMSQPLVPSVGNALEVTEVMQVLSGKALRKPIVEVVCTLGGVLLVQAAVVPSFEVGVDRLREAIASGKARECFGRMIAALGGPVAFADNWARFLPEAPVIREVPSHASGVLSEVDGQALGLCVVSLGGGRTKESDPINPAVGLAEIAPLGSKVTKGQALAVIHAARSEDADRAEQAVRQAMTLGSTAPKKRDLIRDRIVF
ncbi:MAG: thymidine phosphorylase [Pseudomonadota bacterium]